MHHEVSALDGSTGKSRRVFSHRGSSPGFLQKKLYLEWLKRFLPPPDAQGVQYNDVIQAHKV